MNLAQRLDKLGDEVLYPNPGYPIYESHIEFQGGVAVPYGFVPDGADGLALENDLWVLSDEAYYEIRYGGEPLKITGLPGMRERTIILYTFSKRFAMTGWRLGAAIGPKTVIDVPDIEEALGRLKKYFEG